MIETLLPQLLESARRRNHRCPLLLEGAPQACREMAARALNALGPERVAWIGGQAPEGVEALPAEQAGRLLGREFGCVVFDLFSGCDPDALGAVAGTVRGGGVFLLLAPPLARLAEFDDPQRGRLCAHPFGPDVVAGRFLRRLARVLRHAPGVVRLVLDGEEAPQIEGLGAWSEAVPAGESDWRREQEAAVEALLKVAEGRRRRPLVLVSDRGRGKSAALGIAAARLLERGARQVVVTAPSLATVETLFHHAALELPEAVAGRGSLHDGEGAIEFVAPDELVAHPREADLVLVDEAAAIPAPMLERLLQRHARIAFATTEHGYEGTGRGFAIRFQRRLDALTPGWRRLVLQAPVRWAAGDPLERLLFDALLLDAEAAPAEEVARATVEACQVEPLDRDCLEADETLLRQFFGLLVQAHYRTRPFDLRLLLDAPATELFAVRHRGQVVGALAVVLEGGFDAAMAAAVHEQRRRPRGNLLPQTLSAHLGLEQAPLLRFGRVMRIAIHPAVQGRGLGTRLLEEAERMLAGRIDCFGASFGAEPELLDFWRGRGFVPVRIGLTRDQASATHSVVVLRGVTEEGEALVEQARSRFLRNFFHLLGEPLRELDPALVVALARGEGYEPPPLDAQEWADLAAFGFGQRGYESLSHALWALVRAALADPALDQVLDAPRRDALIVRVLQRRGWVESAAALGLSGRAALLSVLRDATRLLLACHAEEWVLVEAQRYMEGEG